MAMSQTSVLKLYNFVIDDVIFGVRDAFLDEGVDDQVLQELKQVWSNKLMASKAVELSPEPPEPQPPPILANSKSSSGKANGTKSKAKQNQAAQQAAAAQQTAAAQQQQQANQLADSTQSIGQSMPNGSTKIPSQTIQQNVVAPIPTTSQSTPIHSPITQSTNPIQQQSTQQQQMPAPPAVVAGLDPNKIVPIQITLPPQPGVPDSQPRVLTIQVPASALQEHQLQHVLTGPIITSIMSLPPPLASSVLQQHVDAALRNHQMTMQQRQMDGMDGDTSDEDGSDVSDDALDGDDDDDLDKDEDDDAEGEGGAEEEPLNSDDDVSEEEQTDLFDTDNVVVCQYDKITRSRNKWKFYLKDGIMNIGGKDYVFQKSNGDAEW